MWGFQREAGCLRELESGGAPFAYSGPSAVDLLARIGGLVDFVRR
ncbi:hypothetical protein BH20GEM1_BH20GEM1_05200 [soil metagenome]